MAKGDASTRVRGEEVKNDLPPKWEPKEIGEEIEGIYIGAREITYSGKTFKTYVIQTDEDDETGESLLSFAGAIADRKMSRIPQGSYVWVKLRAKIKTKQGKANDFEIVVEDGVELLEEKLI